MKAVITGASGGMGEHFARELAKRKYDVTIIARSKDKLNKLAQEIEQDYKVKATVIVADLSDVVKSKTLATKLAKSNFDVVINNAGFGHFGKYGEMSESQVEGMINLNMTTLSLWTNIFLKPMMKTNNGKIINIASIVSFIKWMPNNALYTASKVYVRNLSKNINYELKKSRVSVVSVQPGAINTNWAKTANGSKGNDIGTDPRKFAAKVIKKAIDKNKTDISSGSGSFLSKYLVQLFPKKMVQYFSAKGANIYLK